MRQPIYLAIYVALAILFNGCATNVLNPSTDLNTSFVHLQNNKTTQAVLEKKFYHIDIPSFDGTPIRATIYQPELTANETAPLIVHAHSFSIWRMNSPVSYYGTFMVSGKAALAAWKKGYWVISYDHRGFGGSGGDVQMMNPNYEIQDAIAVIDWAVDNLPNLAFDDESKTDPSIGMLGESYGGALQLLTSIQDPRVDAIVPISTWYNLSEALAPGKHLKTTWAATMLGAGVFTSVFDMGVFTQKPLNSLFTGTLSQEASDLLYQHSSAYYCDNNKTPQADALIIHGFRDTVFPINHAWQNKQCIEAGGQDVRLLMVQGGHLLPTQRWTGIPFFNLEKNVNCGSQSFDAINAVVDWFDEKLNYHDGQANYIPKLCMTQDYESGFVAEHFQVGGEQHFIQESKVRAGMSGLFSFFTKPISWLAQLPKQRKSPTTIHEAKPEGGFFQPTFIPVKVTHSTKVISGIPTAKIKLQSKSEDTVIFAGIAVKKRNSKSFKLVSEQVHPIKGNGNHSIQFSGVSTELNKGDVIGIALYGAHNQYFLNRNFIPKKTLVSGTVNLPIWQQTLVAENQYTYVPTTAIYQNTFSNEEVVAANIETDSQPLSLLD